MGTQSESNSISDAITSWSSATNWTIAAGSLSNSVAIESFFTPINDQEQETADSGAKSPLLLLPPSPDSGPCEITLRFTQKHEIRQVYVRSTARTYELYCATSFQSGNEYLCTVRCGVAARGEEVLHTNDIEVLPSHMKRPSGDLSDRDLKSGSSSSTNEDDWVEVKVPGTPVFANKNNSSLLKSILDPVMVRQDFYEATAEISDADPCTSITIRLLSLQTKSCVIVDEVYVFANPVDTADSEEKVGHVENSAGSSLMTMLVPTLLQLSKTTGVDRNHGGFTSDRDERSKFPDIGSKAIESTNNATEVKQERRFCQENQGEVKAHDVNVISTAQGQSQVPYQVPAKQIDHGHPQLVHVESSLNEVVSRMDRIENFFLRFEENMLKPINSIEARLQRVEQQLEVLTKKSQSSTLPSCSRFSAPDFSCTESDSNSFYNSGSDPTCRGLFESDMKEFHSDIPFVAPDDISNSANVPPFPPTLVVTAPDFSNSDEESDEESENDEIELQMDCLKDKQKPVMSIDDALASALAGFIGYASVQPLNIEDQNDKIASSRHPSEVVLDNSFCSKETDGTECKQEFAISLLPIDNGENAKISEGVDMQFQNNEGADSDTVFTISENKVEEPEESGNEEVITGTDYDQVLDRVDIPDASHENQIDDGSDATQAYTTEVQKDSDMDIVHSVLGFSHTYSFVDFNLPVLDVKFISMDDTNTKHSLGGLLADMPESNLEASCIMDSNIDSQTNKNINLILVEEEPMGPDTNGHITVDFDYCSIMDVPLKADGENVQDCYGCRSQETSVGSLI